MNESKLDLFKDQIIEWKAENMNNEDIVSRLMGFGVVTSRHSVRRALKRWKKDSGSTVKFDGDTGEVISPVMSTVTDPDTLMRELGVNPDEWACDDVVVNTWGDPGALCYQLKLRLKRRKPTGLILPATPYTGFTTPSPREQKGNDYLSVVCSDFHAPFHDQHLQKLFCEWLYENKPGKGFNLGDLMDLPESSRHRKKPEFQASAKVCVDSGHQILSEHVQASPATMWEFIPGNHDWRIRNAIIEHNGDLIDLAPAGSSRPVYDLRELLHLDALGINFQDLDGDYEHGLVQITSKLGAVHGWYAPKNVGDAARKTLEHFGFSVLVGHTHKQSIIHHTFYEIDGKPKVLVAGEVGCMCLADKRGLGYAPRPNWQNGFMTVTTRADGTFNVERAVYVNKRLYWRDQVYG
jgi:hypothetical protein